MISIKAPEINISQKSENLNTTSDIPLNLNSLMKGKITEPIILNKRILHFPGLQYNSEIQNIKKEIKSNKIQEIENPLKKIKSTDISMQKTIQKDLNISSNKSNIEIKTSYTISLDNKDNSQISSSNIKLTTLNDIIESKSPSIETNLNISKTKEELTSSTKTKEIKPNIQVTDTKRLSKITMTPSSDDKKSGMDKSLRGSKKLDSARLSKKLSKDINNLNISANLGKGKNKNRPSLVNIKPKEVKLPAKLIKMKDMISLKYNEPIHDVKEIPRFDIYKPKK